MVKRLILPFFVAACLFGQGASTGDWTAITVHGAPAEVVAFDKSTFIPGTGHCVYGDYKQQFTTEADLAIVCFNYAENRWRILSVNGQWHTEHWGQSGHSNGMFNFIPPLNSIVYYGDGSGSNATEMLLGHLWLYDILGQTGRDLAAGGAATRPWLSSLTPAGGSAFDPVNGKLLIFPAYDTVGALRGYLWDPATNTFSTATTVNQPPALNFFAMEYYNGLIWSFSGNVLYTYNVATDTWNTIVPASCTGADCVGNNPPARLAAGFACSTQDNVCLMAGGATSFNGTAMSDTWIYDPVHNTWTEVTTSHGYTNFAGGSTFDKIRYDSDSNLFVMIVTGGSAAFADGTFTFEQAKPFAFAYTSALNFGRTVNTYTPSTGSLNILPPTSTSNTAPGHQSWAYDPAMTAVGPNLYVGWMESGDFFDNTNCGVSFHPYIQTTPNNGIWTLLPGGAAPYTNTTTTAACGNIDPEPFGNVAGTTDSRLQMTAVTGTLWEAHEKWNNSGLLYSSAYARWFNGSTWSGGIVGCYTGPCGSNIRQLPVAMIAGGSPLAPQLAVIESDHTGFVPPMRLYVTEWTGSGWASLGGQLNSSGAGVSRALGAALGWDGANTYACWNAEVDDPTTRQSVITNAQLFCATWTGSAWTNWASGAALNHTAASWAGRPSMTCFIGGACYVAWTERADNGVAKVYVGKYQSGTFTVMAGTPLNINLTTGFAWNPSLANDGTTLYVVWEEQSALNSNTLGYGASWNGSSWTRLGGPIAASTTFGSIDDIHLTMVGTYPTALWTELSSNNMKQAYVKQWNGAIWNSNLGTPPCRITANAINQGVIGTPYIQQVPVSGCVSPTFGITGGALPPSLTMNSAGFISGSPTAVGSYNVTISVSDQNGTPSQTYTVITHYPTSGTMSGGSCSGCIRQ